MQLENQTARPKTQIAARTLKPHSEEVTRTGEHFNQTPRKFGSPPKELRRPPRLSNRPTDAQTTCPKGS